MFEMLEIPWGTSQKPHVLEGPHPLIKVNGKLQKLNLGRIANIPTLKDL